MSEVNQIAEAQSHAYALAYAIQVIPSTGNTIGVTPSFLASDGLPTNWPCRALLFDSAEEAEQERLAILLSGGDRMPRLEVVGVTLIATVKAVAVKGLKRRVAAA